MVNDKNDADDEYDKFDQAQRFIIYIIKNIMDYIQKTRDDYNKIAAHYARTRNHAGELVQFKSFLKDGQQILDWGCGNARLLYLLAGYDVNYFGLDQSQNFLKIAKKEHAEQFASGRAKFFCTACKEKKFPKNFFDLAFMAASFHHLPDKKTRLKLLKKALFETKPEGRLIILVWNLDSDWAKQKLKADWKKIGDGDYLIPWKNQDGKILAQRYYHNFKKDELKDILEKAGWKIDSIYYNNDSGASNKKEGRNLVAIAQKPVIKD